MMGGNMPRMMPPGPPPGRPQGLPPGPPPGLPPNLRPGPRGPPGGPPGMYFKKKYRISNWPFVCLSLYLLQDLFMLSMKKI